MKHHFKFLSALLILFVSGCVPSLNPLYTTNELITDANIVGVWQYESEEWKFEKNGKQSYQLTHSANGKEAVLSAHLVKLKNGTYLDISPLDLMSENYLYQSSLLGVHTFYKIEINKNQLELKMLDPDLITEYIDLNTINIAHVKSQDDELLLTATTSELQALVESDLELFVNPLVLKKM